MSHLEKWLCRVAIGSAQECAATIQERSPCVKGVS
jgi:hypothetical protein